MDDGMNLSEILIIIIMVVVIIGTIHMIWTNHVFMKDSKKNFERMRKMDEKWFKTIERKGRDI